MTRLELAVDKLGGAVILYGLAYEERLDGPLRPASGCDRHRDRDRPDLQTPDIFDVGVVAHHVENDFRRQEGALRVKHGFLQIEEKIALLARREREVAEQERLRFDELAELFARLLARRRMTRKSA